MKAKDFSAGDIINVLSDYRYSGHYWARVGDRGTITTVESDRLYVKFAGHVSSYPFIDGDDTGGPSIHMMGWNTSNLRKVETVDICSEPIVTRIVIDGVPFVKEADCAPMTDLIAELEKGDRVISTFYGKGMVTGKLRDRVHVTFDNPNEDWYIGTYFDNPKLFAAGQRAQWGSATLSRRELDHMDFPVGTRVEMLLKTQGPGTVTESGVGKNNLDIHVDWDKGGSLYFGNRVDWKDFPEWAFTNLSTKDVPAKRLPFEVGNYVTVKDEHGWTRRTESGRITGLSGGAGSVICATIEFPTVGDDTQMLKAYEHHMRGAPRNHFYRHDVEHLIRID